MTTASQLRQILVDAIATRWQQGERAIASEELYNQLAQAGVDVPEGAMHTIVDDLRRDELIKGVRLLDSSGVQTHGAMVITWVSPTLNMDRRGRD